MENWKLEYWHKCKSMDGIHYMKSQIKMMIKYNSNLMQVWAKINSSFRKLENF